jgi:hypothetical protein
MLVSGWFRSLILGPLAQLAEHLTFNQGVEGSSPSRPTPKTPTTPREFRVVGVYVLPRACYELKGCVCTMFVWKQHANLIPVM